MSPENRKIPDWARQERRQDMAWIQENADIFQLAAAFAVEESGRGTIVIDTTFQPAPAAGHPVGYISQASVEEEFDDDTKRMVKEYDTELEVVLVLLEHEKRTSTRI